MSEASSPPVRLVVVGAGAASLKSTVALNVAVAAATAGVATRLRDLDGASSRALARAAGEGATVALPWAAAPLHVSVADEGEPSADPSALVVVDPPPRLDDAVRAELARASVVLVPVDASPLARRALREVAAWRATREAPPALRVAMARALPRDADRWALLEEIEALAPDALLPATLPAGRRAASAGRERVARLYAPGTRGAAAYAALVGALGLTSTRTTP